MEDEVYEEVIPEEDTDEEGDESMGALKEGENGQEDMDEEGNEASDDTAGGLKTPGEGLVIIISSQFMQFILKLI